MARVIILAMFFVLSGLAPSEVFALGSDHDKGPVARNDRWPEGLQELFNRSNRVHGYWVNSVDVFFYSGETQAFNQFMEAYGKLKKTPLRVVIHPGTKKARSPWDRADRDLPIEWSLLSDISNEKGEFDTQVDLWLGSRIKLEELRIPLNITVVSGREIEKFIGERPQK